MAIRHGERHDGDGLTYRAIRHIQGRPVANYPGLLSLDSVSGTTLTQRYLGFDSNGLLRAYATLPVAPDDEGYVIPQMGGVANTTIMLAGGTDRGIRMDFATRSITEGARQGALAVSLSRDVAISGTWDGNADIALKLASTNYVANGAKGRVCGGEILSRNRGTCSDVQGLVITGENYVGATNVAVDLQGLKVVLKNNGVVAGLSTGLVIEDQSQGSTTGDHGYLTLCSNKNPSMHKADFGINFMRTGTGTGIANALQFMGVAGEDGAWYDATWDAMDNTAVEACIQVKIGSFTGYIPVCASKPAHA